MTCLLQICLGGAIGSGARYPTSIAAASLFGVGFPYGTFIVSVIGSFLLGFVIVEKLMPILEEMLEDALVTVEKVRVLRYRAR